ncbi:MAG TPA: class I SAM-dependent methyltransferase [Blastocatellia bacterium]|nr:class I SAM-dependent methyltransferase [Blastocatellia bacterium]
MPQGQMPQGQTPQMGFPPAMDMARLQGFMNRIMNDLSGAVASIMCAIGDRLGLFKSLAIAGPATSEDLAARAGIKERYAREWLYAMTSAGYVTYDPVTKQFTLPQEHAMALAWEGGPMFMGGVYQHLPGLFRPLDHVIEAFIKGGGVSQAAFDDDFREGMERISAGWFENFLVSEWISALPGVKEKLERGARAADIGCGGGRALIKMAREFPASTFVGYDIFKPALDRAVVNARQAGVADRVSFEQVDAAEGLPEQFDLITTFDVIHDIANPLQVLREIRKALRPDGTFLMLEIRCSDRIEENLGPAATMLYGTSVLYCTPTSIANGGEGLGTMGMPESKIRDLCAKAGFSNVRQLPIENPFNSVYEIRP